MCVCVRGFYRTIKACDKVDSKFLWDSMTLEDLKIKQRGHITLLVVLVAFNFVRVSLCLLSLIQLTLSNIKRSRFSLSLSFNYYYFFFCPFLPRMTSCHFFIGPGPVVHMPHWTDCTLTWKMAQKLLGKVDKCFLFLSIKFLIIYIYISLWQIYLSFEEEPMHDQILFSLIRSF